MASSLTEEFADLEVDCSNKQHLGCTWRGSLKDLKPHLHTCETALSRKVLNRLSNCEDELFKIRKENVHIKNYFELKIQEHYDARFAKKCKELDEMNLQLGQLRKDVDATRRENENLKAEVEDLKARSPIQPTKSEKPLTPIPAKSAQTFFDVTIGNAPAERLIINLFHQAAPLTCSKFVELCTHHKGVGYKEASFDGVSYNGCWANINPNSLPNNTLPSELVTPVENRSAKHDRKGLVGMNGDGENTTKTKFYMTFEAVPANNGKNFIIGEVAKESWPVLDKIKKQQATYPLKPKKEIKIVACGVN